MNPNKPWADIKPLLANIPSVMPLSSDMLPESLKPWIMDIAERMEIPPDYPAAATITALGSIIGRNLGIYPKEKDDWLVVPNLWGGAVGRPSLLKSPAIEQAMAPVKCLMAEERKKFKEACDFHEDDLAIYKAKKEQLEKDLKNGMKKEGNVSDFKAKMEALRSKQPEAPEERRLMTQDPTTEKLGEILCKNPRGILLVRDELTGWLHSLDKAGREGDRSFYLESWNGTGSYTVDRIGRGTLHIDSLCVSIFGGIQPGPLGNYIYQCQKGGKGDDGLMQRFQMLVYPDPPKTWRGIDRWPDNEAKTRAFELFRIIDQIEGGKFGEVIGDAKTPGVRFSTEAQEQFNDWYKGLMDRLLVPDVLSPALEAHLGKFRSLIPSLAEIFHFTNIGDPSFSGPVSKNAISLAILWGNYLESHAKRVYAVAENPAFESAKALLNHIKNGDLGSETTHRIIQNKGWSKLVSWGEVDRALFILEDNGYLQRISLEQGMQGGRPSVKLQFNPILMKREEK